MALRQRSSVTPWKKVSNQLLGADISGFVIVRER